LPRLFARRRRYSWGSEAGIDRVSSDQAILLPLPRGEERLEHLEILSLKVDPPFEAAFQRCRAGIGMVDVPRVIVERRAPDPEGVGRWRGAASLRARRRHSRTPAVTLMHQYPPRWVIVDRSGAVSGGVPPYVPVRRVGLPQPGRQPHPGSTSKSAMPACAGRDPRESE
jgi:hypothetical protein